jgi:phosphoglycolate phosphatase-like HAD superfamily hydrolase
MATNGKIDAVVFGVGGTLISTSGAGARAWERAFEKLHGVPVAINGLADGGLTDGVVGRLAFVRAIGRQPTTRELDRLTVKRLQYLPQAVAEAEEYRVLAGVDALLERLAGDGYLLGIASGGFESAVRVELERAGLNAYFAFGGYGSVSDDRTELTRRAIHLVDADPARTLVIGDTPLDVEAARGAGAVAVGVASGRFAEAELHAAGAEKVLDSLEDDLPLAPG